MSLLKAISIKLVKKDSFFSEERDFVDIRFSHFKIDNLPLNDSNGLRNTFMSIKIVRKKTIVFQGKSQVVKKSIDPKYDFKRGLTLQKTDFLDGKIQILCYEYAFLKSPKLICSCTLDIYDDFIKNTKRLSCIYDPFYSNDLSTPIELEMTVTDKIKTVEGKPKVSFYMKLFSYPLKLDLHLLKSNDEDIIKTVLEHFNKGLRSAVSSPTDHNESEINFMGRGKDHIEFMKILYECLNSKCEEIKNTAQKITSLYEYFKKNNFSKYDVSKEPVTKITEKEVEKNLEQYEDDKKELEIYLQNGYEKNPLDKEYYELNMIRIILKLQNALQARKFFENNCKDSKKLIDLEHVEKNLSEAAAFYNAMVIRRERNKQVEIGKSDDILDKIRVKEN